jgi:hypothetical protein
MAVIYIALSIHDRMLRRMTVCTTIRPLLEMRRTSFPIILKSISD